MNESHIFIHPVGNNDERPGQTAFECTFEEMCRQIEQLPGAYCEPDGAIGWNPATDGSESLGGTIHCIDDRVLCVELFSRLGLENWKRMHPLISGNARTVIQLPQQGRFVSVDEYEQQTYGG